MADVEPMPENTSEECLRKAWAALLRNDLKERDRLCERATRLLEAEGARSGESVWPSSTM